MATHSSVLAWRISEMGEPGGLLSMKSHRVGHDWSDLAAAAAAELLLTFFHGKKMEFVDTSDKCILESTLMLLPQDHTELWAELGPGPGSPLPPGPVWRLSIPPCGFSKRIQGGQSPKRNVPLKTQILSAVFLLNHWRGPKIYTFFPGEK